MLRFFQIIKYSFYSQEFYQDVFRNLKGYASKYLLILVLAVSIPAFIGYNLVLKDLIYSSELGLVVKKFPQITIKDNKLSTMFEQPYTIVDGEKKLVSFVSKSKDLLESKKEGFFCIFNQNDIEIKFAEGYSSFSYKQVFGRSNIEMNSSIMTETKTFFQSNYTVFSLILFVSIFVIKLLYIVLEIVFVSFLMKLFIGIKDSRLSNYFRVIVFAFYPITMTSFIVSIIGKPNSLITTGVIIFIKTYYLVFIVRSLSQKKAP